MKDYKPSTEQSQHSCLDCPLLSVTGEENKALCSVCPGIVGSFVTPERIFSGIEDIALYIEKLGLSVFWDT